MTDFENVRHHAKQAPLMDDDDAASLQNGVNILPIPPALEFPFPPHPAKTAKATRPIDLVRGIVSDINIGHVLGQQEKERRQSMRTESLDQIKTAPPRRPDRGLAPQVTRVPKREEATARPLRPTAQRIHLTDGQAHALTHYTLAHGFGAPDSSSNEQSNPPLESIGSGRQGLTRRATAAMSGKRLEEQFSRLHIAHPHRFHLAHPHYSLKGCVSKKDGRLNISLNETANRGYLAKALGASITHHLGGPHADPKIGPPKRLLRPLHPARSQIPSMDRMKARLPIPKLSIVIMVIGSRGDIQPFLRLGKILKEDYGHRVRIATHPAFKEFVERDSGLEFFSVGGDPSELMAFMVKNPGLVPKPETIKRGEVGRQRDAMYEMFQGFWRACVNATDDESNPDNVRMMEQDRPFLADAIIANPPSFAHVHCAERLGIPLHLMFTFPVTPTQQFPHPLANIRPKQTNVDHNYINFISYPLVEMMTWQGLGDLVNKFRVKTLGLEPMSTLWAPGQLFRLRVPYTYLWSPGLIPKPQDWGPEIDVTGFVFLDLASSFKPPESLTRFLEAGEPPVYIGFGSIVLDDPDKFTKLVFAAVKKAGVRALVSKGWGGLGGGETPENVYLLDNTPHDWLFPRVSAVVHHGGAGTTAIGLKCGKPTMIVPFFGDQPFWGAMVAKAGAGAEPCPYKNLTVDRLAEAIKILLKPETQKGASVLAAKIEEEGDGAINAVESFHRSLPSHGNHSLRCAIFPDKVAVWWLSSAHVRLSALAAELLVRSGKLRWHDLRAVRHYEWNDFAGPGEPLTGTGDAMLRTAVSAAAGIGGTPFRWAKTIKRREKRQAMRRNSMATKSHTRSHSTGTESIAKAKDTRADAQSPVTGRRHSASGEEGIQQHLPDSNMINKELPGEASRLKHGSLDGKQADNKHQDDDQTEGTRTPSENLSGPTEAGTDDEDEEEEGGEEDNMAEELAADAGHGILESGAALARLPMDISLALARGFHNAPRLYGDTTVRTPKRITGMHSGLKAAGEEFTYGVYDGWTGLVRLPVRGYRADGGLGLLKGTAQGIGGLVLKDLAALFGLPAYALKGVHAELTKSRQPKSRIRWARMEQGRIELRLLLEQDRAGLRRTQSEPASADSSTTTLDSDDTPQQVADRHQMQHQQQPDNALSEAQRRADRAWTVIATLRDELELTLQKGFRGRLHVRRNRRRWKSGGVFENVDTIERALSAEQEGRDALVEFTADAKAAAKEAKKANRAKVKAKWAKLAHLG